MVFSEQIQALVDEGGKAYAEKRWEDAADRYAEACEVFAKDGENNAELLVLYGKALFQAAVEQSAVLGGGGDGEREGEGTAEVDASRFQFADGEDEGEGEEEGEEEGESNGEGETNADSNADADPNADADADSTPTFESAWEILDLARLLLEKESPTPASLSSVYDLLGEVSLEAENFPQAAADFDRALHLRLEQLPKSSPLILELHFKLLLALEFCVEDPKARAKAALQMELALESVRQRDPADPELEAELQERLDDLRDDPLADVASKMKDAVGGLLGGDAPTASTKRPALVNDLSGMVKKKKKKE